MREGARAARGLRAAPRGRGGPLYGARRGWRRDGAGECGTGALCAFCPPSPPGQCCLPRRRPEPRCPPALRDPGQVLPSRPGIPARCRPAPHRCSRPLSTAPASAVTAHLPPPSGTLAGISSLGLLGTTSRVQIPSFPWQLLSLLCFRSSCLCCSLPG